MRSKSLALLPLLLAAWAIAPAQAQTPAAKPAAETAKAADPQGSKPAKELFGRTPTPAPLDARAIGFYARGCLAGGAPLAIDGPAWQAMRLSRNRNWGHPRLIALVQKLAVDAQKNDGWPGLLVGDISQPRGGPMLTGHASHQIGLDADIWLTPMPNRRLSEKEREDLSATSMLKDKLSVDPNIWTDNHARLIKRAASYPEVERVLVHPAIKKALCEGAGKLGKDRDWLSKVRPIGGHFYHFHVRIGCPKDSTSCKPQPAPANSDGCGKELDDWMALLAAPPKPAPPKPAPPKPPMTLAQLPAECRAVLNAPPAPVAVTAPPASKTSAAPK